MTRPRSLRPILFLSVILKLLPKCQVPTNFFALWVLYTDTQTSQLRGLTSIIFGMTHLNYRKTTKFWAHTFVL